MNLIREVKTTLAGLTVSLLACHSYAVDIADVNGTKVFFKGFIKADAMVSNYSDGSLSAQNLGRDFYVPSLTPVGGEEGSTQFDMHAKTSRFGLGTLTQVDGKKLKSYIEMDFVASAGGNERVSNSYGNRMRLAYVSYDGWTFGQDWSTFMNVGALPETATFIGAADATIFVRQGVMRYTSGSFQFAIENPETTLTPYGGGARIVTDDNSLPDVVARYNLTSGNSKLVLAAIYRELKYVDEALDIDSSTTGYGVSLTGKVKLGSDDIKFMLNAGSGLGRYQGLNVTNDAVIKENGELEAIDTLAYAIAYRHFWTEQLRSSLVYSRVDIDNDTGLTGSSVTSSTTSTGVNLMYSPAPKLTLGAEVLQAAREIESGADGSMTRFQTTAKLVF